MGAALIRLELGLLPGAVILDLRLPDASGGLVLRRIHRDGLPIRVAVVTALADPQSHPDVGQFPPDAIFRKPVDFNQLLDWLHAAT